MQRFDVFDPEFPSILLFWKLDGISVRRLLTTLARL
jgi:hypothetical protein